ncbi:MAG: hypothetical protein FWG64_09950 [Firmicutes bacterium]|nr:hypothetical protein [Bacillota bacterium]
MENVTLKTFPANKVEALTMLYLQESEDLTALSPEELVRKYKEVEQEIKTVFTKLNKMTLSNVKI